MGMSQIVFQLRDLLNIAVYLLVLPFDGFLVVLSDSFQLFLHLSAFLDQLVDDIFGLPRKLLNRTHNIIVG